MENYGFSLTSWNYAKINWTKLRCEWKQIGNAYWNSLSSTMVSLWDTIYRCWVFHIYVSLQEGTTNDGYVNLQPFTLAATDVFILWQISDPASWPLFIVSYLKLLICSGHKNSMIHSQFPPCAGQGDVAKDSVRAAKFFHSPRGAGEPCVSNSKVFVCLQVCREHLCDTAGFDWTFMDTNSQHLMCHDHHFPY